MGMIKNSSRIRTEADIPSTEEMLAGQDDDRLVDDFGAAAALEFLSEIIGQSVSIDGMWHILRSTCGHILP